jgi:membrane-associated phospholipid phosphatase
VELERPSTEYLLKNQLDHVYNYADLRRERSAEILSQIKGIDIFLGRLSPLHPERHRFTLELLAAFLRALVSAEMRIKHALAVPRPVEFSPQIMPMIQTPGHGTFPAGHAAESFMGATVLFALMKAGNTRYADAGWDDRLARLAARISVNRVIAGVHFPVDLAAGLVLGLAVGRYFVALAKGKDSNEAGDPSTTDLKSYKFVGEEYGRREFPWAADNKGWAAFPWAEILGTEIDLPKSLAEGTEVTFTLPDKERSPVRWLWRAAVKEWQA